MPFIILILSALGGALWFWVRRNPHDAINAAQDAATVIKNAPRKMAFRKQLNAHPVEGIDDPRIAICAISQSFIELDALPTMEQRKIINGQLGSVLNCNKSEAEEMEVLGRWLMTQCQSPDKAITRLGRRLFKIDGDTSWETLRDLLGAPVDGDLSPSQVDAVAQLRRAMHQ